MKYILSFFKKDATEPNTIFETLFFRKSLDRFKKSNVDSK